MPTLLLDMDEVLCDFIGGVCEIFSVSRFALEEQRIPGIWDIVPALNQTFKRDPSLSYLEVTQEGFWEQIHDYGTDFWADLEPTPWFDDLLLEIQTLGFEWHVVTAPSHCPTSYSGKVRWLKRMFGREFDNFCITPHKQLFAREQTILIDDRDLNVRRFIEAGGQALVFPAVGNSLHEFRDDPVEHLMFSLETLLGG